MSKRRRKVETKATKANRMKTERRPSFHFPIQSTPVFSLQSASGSVWSKYCPSILIILASRLVFCGERKESKFSEDERACLLHQECPGKGWKAVFKRAEKMGILRRRRLVSTWPRDSLSDLPPTSPSVPSRKTCWARLRCTLRSWPPPSPGRCPEGKEEKGFKAQTRPPRGRGSTLGFLQEGLSSLPFLPHAWGTGVVNGFQTRDLVRLHFSLTVHPRRKEVQMVGPVAHYVCQTQPSPPLSLPPCLATFLLSAGQDKVWGWLATHFSFFRFTARKRYFLKTSTLF